MLRGPAPAPRTRLPGLALRLFFGLAVAIALLFLGGVGAAYSSYTQLADTLKPRLEAIAHPRDQPPIRYARAPGDPGHRVRFCRSGLAGAGMSAPGMRRHQQAGTCEATGGRGTIAS